MASSGGDGTFVVVGLASLGIECLKEQQGPKGMLGMLDDEMAACIFRKH